LAPRASAGDEGTVGALKDLGAGLAGEAKQKGGLEEAQSKPPADKLSEFKKLKLGGLGAPDANATPDNLFRLSPPGGQRENEAPRVRVEILVELE